MKHYLVLALLSIASLMSVAQNWQSATETFWGKYCFRELNGTWYDALTEDKVMNTMPTDNNIVLAYYWRIPEGKVRADITWTNNYARLCKMHVKVIRPTTGEVLGENDLSNASFKAEEHVDDFFGTIDFPADEFYRVEVTSPMWSYIRQISYITFQHESVKPVMKPRNFGGTSAHMWNWYSTDPYAPSGNAYDWAYIEARVPYEYQYPGTYYMTLGALSGYMGMQTVGPLGEPGDFSRSVLFSVWDNGNMDEDPNLPEYMQSGVMSGNPDAVHTHAGGEGSSASVMLKGDTKWWRPDKWVQFLENTRPETVTIFGKTADGRDTSFIYENTICTAFYKMDDEQTWRYLGTIRSSGQNEHMAGWYSFIEPFTTYAGQFKHRALYRHPAMRAANSGKWYSRNKVDFWDDKYDRDFHYDYGRGASQEYDNCFFFEMGGYGVQTDSSKISNMATDMSFVESINFDSLNAIIDQSVKRDQRILFNTRIDQTADNYDSKTWKPMTALCSNGKNAQRALDNDEHTGWICDTGYPYTLALEADEEQVVTSFNIYWEYKYDYRCLYVDLATSDDGEEWTPVFDSLEIRSGIDRPNISFPHPVKTKYVKLSFYHPFTTRSLMISELRLRGDYDKERLFALAKLELDDANELNHYSAADLEKVKTIYDGGACTDLTALAMALKDVATDGTFYKYSRVAKAKHVSSQRAYCIKNADGYGYLCANGNKQLSAVGATVSGSLAKYAEPVDVTNPNNTWMVLHDEHYEAYYLYNLGAKKFVDVTATSRLSDNPTAFNMYPVEGGYAFKTADSKVLGTDATSDAGAFLSAGSVTRKNVFLLYDNYQFAQLQTVRDSLQQKTEFLDKIALYKENAEAIINAPVGVVGGFTSEAAREVVREAYNHIYTNPQGFLDAIEDADIIELDPDNFVYKIRATNGNANPYMSVDASLRLVGATASKSPDQIWRFGNKPGGYSIHSQGLVLKPMYAESSDRAVTLSANPDESGTYVLSAREWGKNYISSGQFTTNVINGNSSPMKGSHYTLPGSSWYLEPLATYDISLNSVGVTSLYVDFAFQLPDGLQAYAANYVTNDGVIKLTEITDMVPAQTPVLLRGEPYAKFALDIYPSAKATQPANLFNGSYFRDTTFPKGSIFTLSSTNGKPVMKKPALGLVSANQIYIPVDSFLPQMDTYTFDFDELVDNVSGAPLTTEVAASPMVYDIYGKRVMHTVKGNIYIRNHQKQKQ